MAASGGFAGLSGITVFERGWLSSNNVLLHRGGSDDENEDGATLVDTSHCLHADQTVALLRAALGAEPLARIVNTHLHSDHCGGNARLAREFGAAVAVPAGVWAAVKAWDEDALSFKATGQMHERFTARSPLSPGDSLHAGGRAWQLLAAPGHDPDSLILFDPRDSILISADALWENGFGVVFPELEGERAFDDVAAALQRARSRLHGFRAAPDRHARHGAKVLLKYHLMERRREPLAALRSWAERTPLFGSVWRNVGAAQAASAAAWAELLAGELCDSGALARTDDGFADA